MGYTATKFVFIFTSLLIIISIFVMTHVDIVEGGFHKSRVLGTVEFCKEKWLDCMKRARIETAATCNHRINRKFMCENKFTDEDKAQGNLQI